MAANPTPTRFVILCQNRTGSYLLVDLLNQFSDVICHGEVFKPSAIELAGWLKNAVGMNVKEREKYPITYLNRIFKATPKKIAGIKMFWSHNAIAKQYVLENRHIAKIVLTRDHLGTYISNQRARLTGEWTRKATPGGPEVKDADVKIVFEPQVFEKHRQTAIKIQETYSAFERFTGQTFIRIEYDEVAQIEPVREVAKLLGSKANPEQLVPSLKKQITGPIEEMVANYDEMQSYLASTTP